MELDPRESPGEIKSREVELDPRESPGEIKSKEVELDPQESPGEIKSKEVELDPQESPGEIKNWVVELDPQASPGEIKSRVVELDPQESPGEIKSRDVELDPQESPGEIKSREVELGSCRELGSPSVQLFLNGCFSDTVFVTLLPTAVETAISEVYRLLRTDGIPTSLTLFFELFVSSPSHPFPPSLISLMVYVDVKHHLKKKDLCSVLDSTPTV